MDLCFSCRLSNNPSSSTKGMLLINRGIRSSRRGPWEHWHLLCYKYPCYVIHSALKPGTRFSLQITSFFYPHKWSGKIEQAKNRGQILTAGLMENPALWVCMPNKLEGAQFRPISWLTLVLGSVGPLFCQPGTKKARPYSSVWGHRGSGTLGYGLKALFTHIWYSPVYMCL